LDGYPTDRIRSAGFSLAVRGYDRGEVEAFLGEIADWLERGGEEAAGSELVREELARVGDQVGEILVGAHDAAREIREDASVQARQALVGANATAESLRLDADEYAARAREEADAYARQARLEAETDAEASRTASEAQALELGEGARAEAERMIAEANERKRDIETLISDLEQRRDAVLAELEQLASGITGTASRHRHLGDPQATQVDPASSPDPAS
jgi:DivIVA domain-containing protein